MNATAIPEACMTSTNSKALISAISLGLSTMVQPAAKAGATLQTIWLIGQFQGREPLTVGFGRG